MLGIDMRFRLKCEPAGSGAAFWHRSADGCEDTGVFGAGEAGRRRVRSEPAVKLPSSERPLTVLALPLRTHRVLADAYAHTSLIGGPSKIQFGCDAVHTRAALMLVVSGGGIKTGRVS